MIQSPAAIDNVDVIAGAMAKDSHAVGGLLSRKGEDRALDVVGIENLHNTLKATELVSRGGLRYFFFSDGARDLPKGEMLARAILKC